MPLTPILTAHWDEADCHTIGGYTRHHGYEALKKALKSDPDSIIQLVKDSGLRGRGGAGFPTGMKWGFVPQDGKPHYLVVNADESEPGACKDIPLMLANPHSLVEGVIITSYAIRANHAFIYIRGEVPHAHRRVRAAVQEAYAAGHLGKNIHGSGFDLEVVVHSGAGAYICGEETALLDSLEGRRGQPRLKPPFPAVAGLYAAPTVINNVETIANVQVEALGGEHVTSATEAGDDLVDDEEDVVLVAHPLHFLQILAIRRVHATSALNRFRDECCNVVGAELGNELLHQARIVERNPCGVRNERLAAAVPLTVERQPGETRAIRMQSVVRVLTAEDVRLVRLPLQLPVSTCKFARVVDGIGTAGIEDDLRIRNR